MAYRREKMSYYWLIISQMVEMKYQRLIEILHPTMELVRSPEICLP